MSDDGTAIFGFVNVVYGYALAAQGLELPHDLRLRELPEEAGQT